MYTAVMVWWSVEGQDTGSSTVFWNGSTATRDETSSPVWWKSCATPTTSRRPEQRRTALRETPNVSVSTALCTVCCVLCLRSRSPDGPSICQSWSRHTTTHLTPRPASHPTSCSSDRSPNCRWTTCWDVLLALQQGQSTGCGKLQWSGVVKGQDTGSGVSKMETTACVWQQSGFICSAADNFQHAKSSRACIDKRTVRAARNTHYRYNKIGPLDHKMADWIVFPGPAQIQFPLQ